MFYPTNPPESVWTVMKKVTNTYGLANAGPGLALVVPGAKILVDPLCHLLLFLLDCRVSRTHMKDTHYKTVNQANHG